jgi:hypothetical protein
MNSLSIICFKRKIRKFLNTSAHIEGLLHHRICLFETHFSCQHPLKGYIVVMLDAFPRSAGDHLAQNFLRKI